MKNSVKYLLICAVVMSCLLGFNEQVYAEDGNYDIVGRVYDFNDDSEYNWNDKEYRLTINDAETYGKMLINGNVKEIFQTDGIPSYELDSNNISFLYTYGDKYVKANEEEWHITDDSSKRIAEYDIDSKFEKGLVLIQSSLDRKNWNNEYTSTNQFSNKEINSDAIFKPNDIQIVNGCYYRVIIAYRLSKRTKEAGWWLWESAEYDSTKHMEVYEFYLTTTEARVKKEDKNQTYNIGNVVRTDKWDGYFGEQAISKDDLHYNITLGQFFVSGYTEKTFDNENNAVFLKNVGDKVTLWFRLNENIDAIKGDSDLKVVADEAGYDQAFQTPTINMGKGCLIIKYTDYNNNSGEPEIYTNYLEANTSPGADTVVKLFEEGDYEVALDYELEKDGFLMFNKSGHYRINFKFSIRNGNCMVYPVDLKTGRELSNSTIAENGFKLDLANSRYLRVGVKREVLKDSADGLVEDTRFNGIAKDGAEYKDEGIYTITVLNQYTKQETIKRIYVGNNNVLIAHLNSGLPITEINEMVANGAKINDDGSIIMTSSSSGTYTSVDKKNEGDTFFDELISEKRIIIPICSGIVILVIIIVTIKSKKAKSR